MDNHTFRTAPASRRILVVALAGLAVALLAIAWSVSGKREAVCATNPREASAANAPREPVGFLGDPSAVNEHGIPPSNLTAGEPAPNAAKTPDSFSGEVVSKSGLRSELLILAVNGKPGVTSPQIQKATQTEEGARCFMEFLSDPTLPPGARKIAAEALVQTATQASVQAVLGAATKEFNRGNPDTGCAILSSLQIPVGVEGAKGLLNVLFGQEGSGDYSYPLPAEVQSTIRKTLRNTSAPEEVGSLMAQLYADLQNSGQTVHANELLSGVGHPEMIAELAAEAYVQGKSEEASGLLDRLIASDDAGVVGAMGRLASKQPSLLNDASEVLFNWSLQHPDQTQPGVFAEYLSNQTLPPQQRVVAAFGLAGSAGKPEARRALEKAISAEPDQKIRTYLQNALGTLQNGTAPDSAKGSL